LRTPKSNIGSGGTNESNGIYKKEVCVARYRLNKRASEDHQKMSTKKLSSSEIKDHQKLSSRS